jgi:hypothetical protein
VLLLLYRWTSTLSASFSEPLAWPQWRFCADVCVAFCLTYCRKLPPLA